MKPPPQVQRISLDELKHVPCQSCGARRRRSLYWTEELVHRLNPSIQATKVQEVWFCLGCDRQIGRDGAALLDENPDKLTDVEIRKLWR